LENYWVFGSGTGLAGCAGPSMHYVGPTSAVGLQHKNVALVTEVVSGYIVKNDCLFESSHACREKTFSVKALTTNFNKILESGLSKSGAMARPEPALSDTGWVIETQMAPIPPHKHEVIVHYNLGKSIGMSLIPIVGDFTPRYYWMNINIVDKVTIFHNGKAVWHDDIPVHLHKRFSVSVFSASGGVNSSSAYRGYRVAQNAAVSQILTGFGQAVSQAKESTAS